MKKIILAISLFICSYLNADQSQKWLHSLENPRYKIFELKSENLKDKYAKYDFSEVFTPKTEILGYIDPNFRRLKMTLKNVIKVSDDEYKVIGYSEVKGNRCDFEGSINIQQIREYKEYHYGVDDEYKNKGIQSQGIVIGTYKFSESPNQKYSGIFSGIMTSYWYIDSKSDLKLDNIEYFSDNYKHNQYVGVWRMYGSKKQKKANWGEFRIPFSGDLDIGAGEFGINPKYIENGWEELRY